MEPALEELKEENDENSKLAELQKLLELERQKNKRLEAKLTRIVDTNPRRIGNCPSVSSKSTSPTNVVSAITPRGDDEEEKGSGSAQTVSTPAFDHVEESESVSSTTVTEELMKRLEKIRSEKDSKMKNMIEEEQVITKLYEEKLQRLIEEKISIETQIEREQEYMINSLCKSEGLSDSDKRILEIKNEMRRKVHDELYAKLRKEEKEITSYLRDKLNKVMNEKVAIENQLEIEEEYIVNKLQKSLQTVASEKRELEMKLEYEQQQKSDLVSMLQAEKRIYKKQLKKLKEKKQLTRDTQRRISPGRLEELEKLEDRSMNLLERIESRLNKSESESNISTTGSASSLNSSKIDEIDREDEQRIMRKMSKEIIYLRNKVELAKKEASRYKKIVNQVDSSNREAIVGSRRVYEKEDTERYSSDSSFVSVDSSCLSSRSRESFTADYRASFASLDSSQEIINRPRGSDQLKKAEFLFRDASVNSSLTSESNVDKAPTTTTKLFNFAPTSSSDVDN